MCGIWALLSKSSAPIQWDYYKAFTATTARGPDRSRFIELNKPFDIKIGFHRLSIMDLSTKGDQPFIIETPEKTVYTICNGEIYNFKELAQKYDLVLTSGSDCEVIPHLFMKCGIDTVVKELIAECAFMIFVLDKQTSDVTVHVARDPYGVRPLFYTNDDDCYTFSSEPKSLNKDSKTAVEFKGGHYMTLHKPAQTGIWEDQEYIQYHDITSIQQTELDLETVKKNVYDKLVEAVKCRLASDVPVGCLLSGGLDSSLTASISAKFLKEEGKRLNTFSIGMPGSTDEKYARMVAKHIDSDHTHIELNPEEWLGYLENVIYTIGTYDITTIRASTGQYLAAKWIRENTNIKVLMIGDGSDELCAGYMYFHKAPTPMESHLENIRLLTDISKYDVLRADRGVACNGLEARVPFLDIRFTDYYLSVDPKLRIPVEGKEKWLLRESFRESCLLPLEVLYRPKEAFSDGCSSSRRSWSQIIKEHVETLYTDEELVSRQAKYTHLQPHTKEALYFRETFEKHYPNFASLLTYFWLPKWVGNVTDPSARVLDVYKQQVQQQ
jgi:asparagine synthase (glutamine-hydrolysing)